MFGRQFAMIQKELQFGDLTLGLWLFHSKSCWIQEVLHFAGFSIQWGLSKDPPSLPSYGKRGERLGNTLFCQIKMVFSSPKGITGSNKFTPALWPSGH